MKKRQAGQAFIWVLIVLAVGSLVIVPALGLTSTSLKSSQIVNRQTKGLYAADAGQEWVLWSLTQPGFTDQLPEGEPVPFDIDVCGIHVDITIVMQALEGQGGLTLATEATIKPTKTVDTGFVPNYWVPDRRTNDYVYTISLEQLSSDNSVTLDAIYDLPPGGINAYIGPTELLVDGQWLEVPDPDSSQLISKGYLMWPAEYDKDTHTGTFSSNPAFFGVENFEVREVKELRFWVRGTLAGQRAPQFHVPERRGGRRRPGRSLAYQPRFRQSARRRPVHGPSYLQFS